MFFFLNKGRVDLRELEEEYSDCSGGKCKGLEAGTRLKCWRQSEEGSVTAGKEQRSQAIPDGDGLGFVLKGIGRSQGAGSTSGF